MIEGKTGIKQHGNRNMRAVVHTHKDSSEAMKAFTEKRANMAIGYVKDCSAAEIRFLRHELYNGTIRD
jgi:hypothetical protein